MTLEDTGLDPHSFDHTWVMSSSLRRPPHGILAGTDLTGEVAAVFGCAKLVEEETAVWRLPVAAEPITEPRQTMLSRFGRLDLHDILDASWCDFSEATSSNLKSL